MTLRKRVLIVAVLLLVTLAFQSSVRAPIHRPPTATVPDAPAFLWMPYFSLGTLEMNVGEILEFDYGYGIGGPGSTQPTISFSIDNKKVIKYHQWGLHSLYPNLVGGVAYARYFKAVGPGTTFITVKVDATDYLYVITVRNQ